MTLEEARRKNERASWSTKIPTYSDVERVHLIGTELKETAEEAARVKIAAGRLLDRMVKLEDNIRMIIRMADKIATTPDGGPPDGKSRDNIYGEEPK